MTSSYSLNTHASQSAAPNWSTNSVLSSTSFSSSSSSYTSGSRLSSHAGSQAAQKVDQNQDDGSSKPKHRENLRTIHNGFASTHAVHEEIQKEQLKNNRERIVAQYRANFQVGFQAAAEVAKEYDDNFEKPKKPERRVNPFDFREVFNVLNATAVTIHNERLKRNREESFWVYRAIADQTPVLKRLLLKEKKAAIELPQLKGDDEKIKEYCERLDSIHSECILVLKKHWSEKDRLVKAYAVWQAKVTPMKAATTTATKVAHLCPERRRRSQASATASSSAAKSSNGEPSWCG